jgi:hypothetical protein
MRAIPALCRVFASHSLSGIDVRACLVPVLQADSQSGGVAPTVSTVGFPDSTVRESRDRLRSALRLARSGDERKHFKSKRLNGEKKS